MKDPSIEVIPEAASLVTLSRLRSGTKITPHQVWYQDYTTSGLVPRLHQVPRLQGGYSMFGTKTIAGLVLRL